LPPQNPQSILADLASMLLSNLTASSVACSAVLSLKISIIPKSTQVNGFYATQSRCGTSIAPDPYPSGMSQEVPALPLLLDAFSQGAEINEFGDRSKRTRKGELHFLASVFANLSVVCHNYTFYMTLFINSFQAPAGRSFFLEPRPVDVLKPESDLEYSLAKIVPFTEHKDKIRRGGVTSTIK
jgi:hypothetical protein